MTKKEYVEYFNIYKALMDKDFKLYNATDGAVSLLDIEEIPAMADAYLNLMQEATNDMPAKEDDYGALTYFVYELECGKEWKPGCFTCNNKDVSLETIEDVYDFVISKN